MQQPKTRRRLAATGIVALMVLLAACQPTRIGGPGATIGNQIDPVNCPSSQPVNVAPCGPQPMIWAAINGPYDHHANGDPYSTKCPTGANAGVGCDATTSNPNYRNTGYAYGIDVAAADVGVPLTISAYDIGDYPRTTGTGAAGADCNAGVAPFSTNTGTTYTSGGAWVAGFYPGSCQTGDDSDAQNMDLELFDNDGSDNTVTYASTVPGCHFSQTAAQLTTAAATYKNQWATICTFTPTMQGIYPLRVRNSGIAGMTDTGAGTNAYALRVVGGTSTQLTPLDDQSVFVQTAGPNVSLYLAQVPASKAGKKIWIDLYDPGDIGGGGTVTVQVKAPPGGSGSIPAGTGTTVPAAGIATMCRYNSTPSLTIGPATPDLAQACTVVTHTNNVNPYNEHWVRIEVVLDAAYSCTTDCWWTLEYNFGSALFASDRLTYTVQVVG